MVDVGDDAEIANMRLIDQGPVVLAAPRGMPGTTIQLRM